MVNLLEKEQKAKQQSDVYVVQFWSLSSKGVIEDLLKVESSGNKDDQKCGRAYKE